MCADCGCGCKKGKPEKGCKCDCKTCTNARHESVEKAFNDRYKRGKHNTTGLVAGTGAGAFIYSGNKDINSSRKNAVRAFRRGDQIGLRRAHNMMRGGSRKMIGGAALGAAAAAEHMHSRNVRKSAFFAEDVEKAFNPMSGVKAIKGALNTVKSSGFKSGVGQLRGKLAQSGSNMVQRGNSAFSSTTNAGKLQSVGRNLTGRAMQYSAANPGKAAAIGAAGGAGLIGTGAAIKKSDNVSAFGVEHTQDVSKRFVGKPGDKRNTKYAAAGYGGLIAGAASGRRIAGGKNTAKILAEGNAAGLKAFREAGGGTEGIKAANASIKANPATLRIWRGNKIGAVTGTALGAGGYAAYRKNKRK